MKPVAMAVVVFVSAAIVGCSNSLSPQGEQTSSAVLPTIFGVCDHTTHSDSSQRHCREWTGSGFENFDLSVSCNAIENGVYSDQDLCATDNLVGVCVMNETQAYETRFYYYSSDWNENTGADNCASKDLTSITGNTPTKWYSAGELMQ